ncbi:MAG: transcription termination/antitermination protein NusG [Candidatus Auribacterota bacterium]|nr:transcription termination/antitermination protein NusG [Candidatus Auribacterota bacterium]
MVEKKWYVVHVLSGQEKKALGSLEKRIKAEGMEEKILQVLIPTENVSEVKSGKRRITPRKFFPGYMLVNMEMDENTYYVVKNSPAVLGFIGSGTPVPLQEHEINDILDQIEEKKEKVKPKIDFEKGEAVKIKDGPFVSLDGIIEDIDPDRGKLRVMVTIFGRATPVELEYWQVEKE